MGHMDVLDAYDIPSGYTLKNAFSELIGPIAWTSLAEKRKKDEREKMKRKGQKGAKQAFASVRFGNVLRVMK